MSRRPVVKCLPDKERIIYLRKQWAAQRARRKKRREEARMSELAKQHELLAKQFMYKIYPGAR